MLQELRGTRHQVITGITVIHASTGETLTESMASDVTLRDFSDEEIEASIATGTPRDKAGAYAVQDQELRPASKWEGCYTNIVGLPLCRLMEMLHRLGWKPAPGEVIEPHEGCGPECPALGAGATP